MTTETRVAKVLNNHAAKLLELEAIMQLLQERLGADNQRQHQFDQLQSQLRQTEDRLKALRSEFDNYVQEQERERVSGSEEGITLMGPEDYER